MAQKRETRREDPSLLATICNLLIRREEKKEVDVPCKAQAWLGLVGPAWPVSCKILGI